MASEDITANSGMATWISNWWLAALLLATIAMTAIASAVYEFGLEPSVYAYFGWPFQETFQEEIIDVLR